MDGGCTRVRWFCSLQHHRADGIKKRVSFKDPYRRCNRQVDSFLPSALTLQRYKYFLITNNKHRKKWKQPTTTSPPANSSRWWQRPSWWNNRIYSKDIIGYLNFKAKCILDDKVEHLRIAVQLQKGGKFYYNIEVNMIK